MEVWPGFVAVVGEYEGGLHLQLDVANKIVQKSTVYDIMRECSRMYVGEWQNHFCKKLLGYSVMAEYNQRVYRVDDIDFTLNPASTFPRHDQKEIRYCDYYKQQYDIDIKDLKQPILIHRAKKHHVQSGNDERLIGLIPELCVETGISESQRNNFQLTKGVGNITRLSPEMRQRAYEDFIRNIHCKYHVRLENWAIIYTHKDAGPVRTFEEHMFRSTKQMSIFINKPALYPLANDNIQGYLKTLRDIINNGLQIVVIVFPSLREDKYGAVKKLCCVELPIASQVFLGKTLSRPDKARSIVQKIALQMNCKMGGSLSAVEIPVPKTVKLMVVGMDTYHEGAQKSNSVSAMVASMNEKCTRWYSKVSMQGKGQEIMDQLKAMFASCLKQFHRVNGKFPDRIIIYRDGVGDGHMQLIKDYEIAQFLSVFTIIAPDYNPKFTFLVVQKRVNSRIFLQNRGQLENPNPGTIVDHTITRKHLKDFFLVSQLVRQGTVSPTHYVILYDSENSQLRPDMAQKITYKLCHLYYNWPGTVRVPAPCQYAHKLAYLIGQNVKKPHADVLSDKLFYL